MQLIDIRTGERQKVINLFFQNFFDGLGTAFFYSMALFIFLNGADFHHALHLYPFVFLFSGLIILFVAPVYDWIENKSRTDYLTYGLGIFVLLLVFISYFLLTGTIDKYTGIALLIAHQLIYYFRQTQFWGLSAISFDVLQSKRLFSIVSAGDLPAKFLGYVLIFQLLESGTLQPSQLIFFAAGSYLISFYFLRNVFNSDHSLRHGSHHHFHSQVKTLKFFGNHLVRSMFYLGIFIIMVVFIVDYAFTKIVMHKIHDDDIDVYKLVSTVLYVTYGIATLLKIFITNRVYDKLGLKKILVLTPILLIIIVLIAFFYSLVSSDPNKVYSWMFISAFISFLIFRDVLEKPVFLTLFQPLSNKMKLKGHTIIKGIAEPAGYIFASGALLIYYNYFENYNLVVFGLVILIPLILWVISALNVKKIYADTLIHVINRKLLVGKKLLLLDKDALKHLMLKLDSDREAEVLFALGYLKNNGEFSEKYIQLLDNKSNLVKLAAWETIFETMSTEEISKFLPDYFSEHDESELSKKVHYLFAKKTPHFQQVFQLINHEHPIKSEVLLNGWLHNPAFQNNQEIQKLIHSFCREHSVKRKAAGLRLLKQIPLHSEREIVLSALKSDEEELVKSAISASFSYLDNQILIEIFPLLSNSKFTQLIKKEMIESGDNVIPFLLPYISDTHDKISVRLAQIVSHIDTENSAKECITLLARHNPEIRYEILKGLVNSGVFNPSLYHHELNSELEKEFSFASELISHSKNCSLSAILDQEIHFSLRRIFLILSLMYNKESIIRAEEGYYSNNKDYRASSIEALNMNVKPEYFNNLKYIFDYFERPPKKQTDSIDLRNFPLREIQLKLNQWTIAVLLKNITVNEELKKELACHSSPIIIEQLNRKEMKESDNLQILEKVLSLKQTTLFSSTSENVLIDIAMLSKEFHFEPNVTIMRKGEKGTSMYIIQSGKVKIHDGGSELAILNENDFFGELSMLETETRSADATTLTESRLLRIDQDAIYEIIDDRSEVAKGIIKVLCQRIRTLNEKFVKEKNHKTSN